MEQEPELKVVFPQRTINKNPVLIKLLIFFSPANDMDIIFKVNV